MIQRRLSSGFSMLELSIVIVIVAVITGMGITATLGIMESAKRTATQNKLDVIEQALMTFREKYNRLPCPAKIELKASATYYGIEADPPGDCTSGTPNVSVIGVYTVWGGVPVQALGLSESFMEDGWGRKIRYVVDNNATHVDAFDVIGYDEFCEIEVRDTNSANITGDRNYVDGAYDNGAVYALISHGANGYGGYTEQGNVQVAGVTDGSHEATNCRCGTVPPGAGIPLRLVVGEESSTFDDIVRFKEPWQLQTKKDVLVENTYAGPDLAMSFNQNSTSNIKLFERQCGQIKQFSGTPPTNTGMSRPQSGLEFLRNNSHIFVYSGGTCYRYPVTGNTVGLTSVGSITCPTWDSTTDVAMSENGYLVISKTASPYIEIFKMDGTANQSFNMSLALDTALPSMPTDIEISKTGKYIAFTRSSAGTYGYVYVRAGPRYYERIAAPKYTVIPSYPAPAPAIAFSDDETHLAAGRDGSGIVYYYTINPVTHEFTLTTTINASGATSSVMDFSPDGNYLAVLRGGPVAGDSASTKITIFDTSGSGIPPERTTAGRFATNGTAFTDARFSADSNFLAASYSEGDGNDAIVVLRRTDVETFTHFQVVDQEFGGRGEEPMKLRFKH